MQRYVTALLVAFTLCAAQYAYSLTIVPLTTAGAPIARPRRSSNADYIPASFIEAAERYFPDTEWIEHAKWQWQGASEDDAVLYFQNITRDPAQGELVKVSPLAVLWKDPDRPDAPPYRLMADSALIEFENPISEDAAIDLTFKVKPGRIVGAFLDGAVSIDGPDGLLIAGRTFVFSEVDGTLYSDEAVRFQYGPTDENSMRLVGSAVQLAMSLIKTDEPVLGEDMPHIGGLAQLRLRSQVKIDADFELDDTPQHAQITSEGPFEYDATKREATFSKAVNVTRVNDPQGKPLTDTLECEWLGIYFDDLNGSPDEGKPEALGLFDGLRFRRLRAMGSTELFGGQFSRRGRATFPVKNTASRPSRKICGTMPFCGKRISLMNSTW